MSSFPCWEPEIPQQKAKKNCRRPIGSIYLWSPSGKEWSGWTFSINNLEKFPSVWFCSSGWISTTWHLRDRKSKQDRRLPFFPYANPRGNSQGNGLPGPCSAIEPGIANDTAFRWNWTREMYQHVGNLGWKRHRAGSYQTPQNWTPLPGSISAWDAAKQSSHWKSLHSSSLAGI